MSEFEQQHGYPVGSTRVRVVLGNIVDQHVGAIVNAANSSLLGGGGVDGAIHRAGGPDILEACRAIRARQGKCAAGQAVVTTAGKLHADHVVHTVGPFWSGGEKGEPELLRSAYDESFARAREAGARSIAFPSISTGAYRYPFRAATEVAVDAALAQVAAHPDAFDEVRFVAFSARDFMIYREVMGG